MKAIRVLAVGLIISAFLISSFAADFLKWELNTSIPFATLAATDFVSHSIAGLSGLPIVFASSFIILCLGIGFLLSATIYAKLEAYLTGVIEAFRLRKENTDYAKTMREAYLAWLPKRFAL